MCNHVLLPQNKAAFCLVSSGVSCLPSSASVYFTLHGRETCSFRRRAGFQSEMMWSQRRHSVSNSVSTCLNWRMVCQLWIQVLLPFNMLRSSAHVYFPSRCERWLITGKDREEGTSDIAGCCRSSGVCNGWGHCAIVRTLNNLHVCLI